MPAGMDNPSARDFRLGLVSVYHLPHPVRLAGQIAVMRSGGDAGFKQLGAVHRERPYCRANHPGAAGHIGDKGAVLPIPDNDQGICTDLLKASLYSIQLVPVPAANCPAKVCAGRAVCQMKSHAAADGTRGAP